MSLVLENRITNAEILQISVRATQMMNEHSCIRFGQALFNTLHDVSPGVANEIRGTEFDPFYDDSKVEAFFEVLYSNAES